MSDTQQSDELKQAVKRFCRTDQAADNLVAYITQQTQEARIDELERVDQAYKWKSIVTYSGFKKWQANRLKAIAQLKANTNKEGQ